MPHFSEIESHDVEAEINYFPSSPDTIPTSIWKPRYVGVPDSYTRKMKIHNIRGKEESFNLDRNGFQFVTLPEKERKTDDDETIVQDYYPELEELSKRM